jgi:hypothetical protein
MLAHRPVCRALATAVLASLFAACSDSLNSSRSISLSVTTATSRAALPAGSATSAAIQIGSGPNSLSITQAQATLEKIELAGAGPCADAQDDLMSDHDSLEHRDSMEGHDSLPEHEDDGEGDCQELRVGPTTVNLPVDGSTQVILDALVPPGTYSGVEAKVDTVRVTGVYTDTSNQTHAFSFAADVDAHVEAGFQPPVTVGSGTSNVTVDVDIASWFKDGTGAVLDPTNPANARIIIDNIRRSARAFEDDNPDGWDDHGEGEGRH